MTDVETEPPMAALVAVIRTLSPPVPSVSATHWLLSLPSPPSAADASAMASQGTSRLLAYRALVHNRIRNTLVEFMPRATRLLGRDRLSAEVAEFLADQAPKSPYLREVPGQWLAWVQPRWSRDTDLPPWFADLALHELSDWDIRNDPAPDGEPTGRPIDLESGIAVHATMRQVPRTWMVHRMPMDADLTSSCEPCTVPIFGFRASDDSAKYLEIKPRSARMVERLATGETLREALLGACADVGEPLTDEILAITASTLADLLDRGFLLGGS